MNHRGEDLFLFFFSHPFLFSWSVNLLDKIDEATGKWDRWESPAPWRAALRLAGGRWALPWAELRRAGLPPERSQLKSPRPPAGGTRPCDRRLGSLSFGLRRRNTPVDEKPLAELSICFPAWNTERGPQVFLEIQSPDHKAIGGWETLDFKEVWSHAWTLLSPLIRSGSLFLFIYTPHAIDYTRRFTWRNA